jgi:SAM-dependent methyltransferase
VPTRVSVDINPAGLDGLGVCADGRRLPFADGAFDLLTAFDVVEHFEDEAGILLELARVVRGGGQIGIAVPAYEWAWSPFDVAQGHHRRYTRPRLPRFGCGTGCVAARRMTRSQRSEDRSMP